MDKEKSQLTIIDYTHQQLEAIDGYFL